MKQSLRILAVISIVLACLVVLVLGLLGTTPGLAITTSFVSSLISTPERKIEITDLSGILTAKPKVGSLAVSDTAGVWLLAKHIQSGISPGALLFGRIDISHLSVGEVDIARQPVAAPQADTPADDGALLPAIGIRIENIFVQSMHFSEPVLGEEAMLQLTGSVLLEDSPVDLSGRFDLVRTDGTDGEISAQWKISPESKELELELAAREPSDGLIARAVNIFGLPAVELNLSGKGPLDNWKAQLAVSLDGNKTVEGNVLLSLTDEKQAIDGTLDGNLAPLLPRQITPLFAGNTHIELSAERAGDKTLRLHRFTAKSALLSADIAGHALPDTDDLDFQGVMTFGSPDSQVAFDLPDGKTINVGYTKINTSLKGRLDRADWTLSGSLQSLSDGAFTVRNADISGRSSAIDFLARAGSISMELGIASLDTGQDALDELLKGSVRAVADVQFDPKTVDITALRSSAGALAVDGSGAYSIANGAYDFLLNAQMLQQAEGPFHKLFGSQTARFTGRVAQDENKKISLSDLRVESGNLQATGKASLVDKQISLDSSITLAKLSMLQQELTGGLDIALDVTGTMDQPEFDVRATGKDVYILQKPLKNLVLAASGIASPFNPQANIKLDGRYEDQPLSLSAIVTSSADGIVMVDTLDLRAPGARAQGQMRGDVAGIMTGDLDVEITSLAQLGPLLLQEGLAGSLKGAISFSARDNKQIVSANINADDLQAGGARLNKVTVTAELVDPQGQFELDARLAAGSVNIGDNAIQDLRAAVSGNLQSMPFSVTGNYFNAPLAVTGEVSTATGATTVELRTATASVRDIPIELVEAVTITLAETATHLEKATLRVGEGTVSIVGKAADQLAFDIAVNGLPVALIENIAATGLRQSGTLSASATVSGKISEPVVSYDLTIGGFSVEAMRQAQISAISINSSGTLRSNVLTTTSQASGNGLQLDVSGTVDLGKGPALDLNLSGSAPFGIAALPLSDAGIQLRGIANLSMVVTGSVADPVINGRLTTTDADFQEQNSSLTIRDINAELDFDGSAVRIVRFEGGMGSSGTVSVSGSVGIDPASGLPANLVLDVKDGTYSNGELVTTRFDADITVIGALTQMGTVGGTVNLQRTDITIPDQLPASIPFVDVTHRNASQSVVEQSKEFERAPASTDDNSGNGGLLLDISVGSPTQIYLRGRGIDAEFGGSIQITGSTDAPRIRGSYNLLRGRIEILAKRFDFDKGTITFAGPPDPLLNFQTSTTSNSVTYSIIVGGTASAPKISFGSSPTMPQDEILANLFFGKGISNLSAFQIAQLANAVATISGANSGSSLLDRLRGVAGLADVELNTGDGIEDSSVGVGQYLNDRTYINVEKGLTGNSGRVTIDLDLTEDLKVRGEADTDGNTKAGVFFERDY